MDMVARTFGECLCGEEGVSKFEEGVGAAMEAVVE
jgi:hypothetical protein